jgi:thiamine-phosphate pyrophosphorylase
MIKSYLITDSLYYGSDTVTFKKKLHSAFEKNHVDYALYRDKNNPNYSILAKEFILTCKDYNVQPIIHQDAVLAHKLDAFGVHLTSEQFDKIEEAKKLCLFVVVSTHTIDEALYVSDLGVDALTYSPIFDSPSKPNPKGLAPLKEIVGKINTKIIALGGITTDEQIKAVESCGVFAYASIRKFI